MEVVVQLLVVSGQQLPKVDKFSEIDPFVKFVWEEKEYKTPAIQVGPLSPSVALTDAHMQRI